MGLDQSGLLCGQQAYVLLGSYLMGKNNVHAGPMYKHFYKGYVDLTFLVPCMKYSGPNGTHKAKLNEVKWWIKVEIEYG